MWPAGKVTAEEYLSSQLPGAPAATVAAVKAFHMPDPLDWGDYVAVSLAAMVLADQDGDGGLNAQEFWDFLNPEGARSCRLRHGCFVGACCAALRCLQVLGTQ